MREPVHTATADLRLPAVFHALSDPARLGIVARLLREGEVACSDFRLALAKATRSHHFRVLREAGIIHTRWAGKHQFASLRRADLDARFPGLLDLLQRSTADPESEQDQSDAARAVE